MRLAAATGERGGELAALRWTDVDWERHMLSVSRSLVEARRRSARGANEDEEETGDLDRRWHDRPVAGLAG